MSATPYRFPEGRLGRAELRYRNNLPVLCVEGGPQEIGAAVGELGVRAAPRMAGYPDDLLRHYWASWLRPALLWAGGRMVRRLEASYQEEFEAIVRSSGVQREALVLGNTLFDLKKILACSALLAEPARSATGGPLLGRNLDYPSRGYAHEHSLVTVYRQRGCKGFVSVGFPGLMGCLSGMNEDGLALAVLEVYQAPLFLRRLDINGTPYALCFRRLLQSCATVDEARQALERMQRTTLYNLAVADKERVAVFEVTPRRVRERRSVAGACVCTNHFCLDELRPPWAFNVFGTFDRHRVLSRVERDVEHFDVAGVQAGLHAANQGDHTLQTMVFEPAALRLHLAVGQLPSSAGPLRTLELAGMLRG